MQSIDTGSLGAFDRRVEELLRRSPQERRAMLLRAANEIHRRLAAHIQESGIRNPGRVAGWQRVFPGSRGGYAAIRAIGTREGASTGRESPGAITNYLEHGHRIRPRGTGKDYRPRIQVAFVPGRHFYRAAQGEAGAILRREGEALAGKMAEAIGGNG